MKKEKLTYEMIKNGIVSKRTTKAKSFDSYASQRLLKESGQVISDAMQKVLDDTTNKWYYYKKVSDENKGAIIVGLHSKNYEGWIYLVISQKGEVSDYETISEAKASFNK